MIVFAFDRTDNTPVTGDAANITANLRKDNGSAVATNDVNPTETEDGFYAFDLTQAETNADVLQGFPASVTADVQVIAVPGVIYTTPNSFGDDVIQTADHTAAIADVPTNSEFNARTLVAASYFDPAADTVANVTLVATTTTNTDMVGTNGANTVVPPSVAQFNARTILSADYFDPSADTVANVTLVATTTTNTDMRGTDGANTTTPPTTAQIWAETTRVLTSGVNIVLAKGVGLTGLNDLSSAQVNAEMLDVLTTDTFTEVTVPGATASIKDMIHYTFSRVKNKTTQTATTLTVRNDGDSGNLGVATVSDDGTTFTKGKEA